MSIWFSDGTHAVDVSHIDCLADDCEEQVAYLFGYYSPPHYPVPAIPVTVYIAPWFVAIIWSHGGSLLAAKWDADEPEYWDDGEDEPWYKQVSSDKW